MGARLPVPLRPARALCHHRLDPILCFPRISSRWLARPLWRAMAHVGNPGRVVGGFASGRGQERVGVPSSPRHIVSHADPTRTAN